MCVPHEDSSSLIRYHYMQLASYLRQRQYIRRKKGRRWRLPLPLCCLLSLLAGAAVPDGTAAQQEGLHVTEARLNERVLVVYNANDAASAEVADHYMRRRNIPASNKCAVTPADVSSLSWEEFNSAIKTPVRRCLDSLGRDNILYIVFSYHTPFRVFEAPPSLNVFYPAEAVIDGDRTGLYWGGGGAWSDATQDLYPDWIQVNFDGAKTISEIDVFTLQDDVEQPQQPTPEMTFSRYGITAFDVQYWTGAGWATVPGGSVTGNTSVWRQFTFAELTTDKIRVLVNNSLAGHSRITEIEAYQSGEAQAINVAHESHGSKVIASSVLQTRDEAGTALDQLTADIWDHTSADFAVNPYYARNRSKQNVYPPFVSLADYRAAAGPTIYSVWRLDAGDAELAKGLVDKAIFAESNGLAGRGCFDRNRGSISYAFPDAGYVSGDWDIYRAAEFAREMGFPVVEDANPEEFGTAPAPLRCDGAALYAGWYSLINYNDAFSWAPGAIGFHLDSGSALDPRGGRNWAANAIKNGITVTAGSVSEPYLEGLERVDGVFRNLFQGANVGDALLRNTYWLRWNVIYLGDPLYRPFPASVFPPQPSPLPGPWISQDVGQVAIAGASGRYQGNISIRGSGALGGEADSFHYAYQSLSGDGEVVAHVSRVENTNPDASAGVMIREHLGASARSMAVYIEADGDVGVRLRQAADGISWWSDGGRATVPSWLKVARSGSTFRAYKSSDGVNWILVKEATFDMSVNAYAGLAVDSLNGRLANKAFFDYAAVNPVNTVPTPTPTPEPTPTPTPAPPGTHSLSLDGATAYAQVPASPSLNITGPLTLEAWIKPNATGAQQGIVERYEWTSTAGGYGLRLTAGGKLGFFTVRNSAEYDYVEGGTSLTAGVWHHVAGVYDGTQLRVYVDGRLDGAISARYAPAANAASLKLGARGDDATFRFDGLIDEARVTASALYAADFAPAAQLQAGAGARGLWKFDDRSAADSSGGGNHGALLGGASFSTDAPAQSQPPPAPTPTPTPEPAPAFALTASPGVVAAGGTISVNWSAPAGHSALDWVGLYRVGAGDYEYLAWQYTGASTSSGMTFAAPAEPRQYELRYFLNDGFSRVLVSNTVTVP